MNTYNHDVIKSLNVSIIMLMNSINACSINTRILLFINIIICNWIYYIFYNTIMRKFNTINSLIPFVLSYINYNESYLLIYIYWIKTKLEFMSHMHCINYSWVLLNRLAVNIVIILRLFAKFGCSNLHICF